MFLTKIKSNKLNEEINFVSFMTNPFEETLSQIHIRVEFKENNL